MHFRFDARSGIIGYGLFQVAVEGNLDYEAFVIEVGASKHRDLAHLFHPLPPLEARMIWSCINCETGHAQTIVNGMLQTFSAIPLGTFNGLAVQFRTDAARQSWINSGLRNPHANGLLVVSANRSGVT